MRAPTPSGGQRKPVFPESPEPIQRERGLARRILNVSMAQVRLERPRIDAVTGELVAG
jgi:hypothetical protein